MERYDAGYGDGYEAGEVDGDQAIADTYRQALEEARNDLAIAMQGVENLQTAWKQIAGREDDPVVRDSLDDAVECLLKETAYLLRQRAADLSSEKKREGKPEPVRVIKKLDNIRVNLTRSPLPGHEFVVVNTTGEQGKHLDGELPTPEIDTALRSEHNIVPDGDRFWCKNCEVHFAPGEIHFGVSVVHPSAMIEVELCAQCGKPLGPDHECLPR